MEYALLIWAVALAVVWIAVHCPPHWLHYLVNKVSNKAKE